MLIWKCLQKFKKKGLQNKKYMVLTISHDAGIAQG